MHGKFLLMSIYIWFCRLFGTDRCSRFRLKAKVVGRKFEPHCPIMAIGGPVSPKDRKMAWEPTVGQTFNYLCDVRHIYD